MSDQMRVLEGLVDAMIKVVERLERLEAALGSRVGRVAERGPRLRRREKLALIDRWAAAFRLVHGKEPPGIWFSNGWFRVGVPGNHTVMRTSEAVAAVAALEALEARVGAFDER